MPPKRKKLKKLKKSATTIPLLSVIPVNSTEVADHEDLDNARKRYLTLLNC